MALIPRTRSTVLLALGLGLGGLAMAADLVVLDPKEPTKGDKTPGGKPLKDPSGGPPPVVADEGGESPTADHADDADDATTGTWADEGGESPTADSADHGDVADSAPTGDSADWADTADTADVADHAADVADCAGGPFLGGACGDLRTDGRLGIGTDPAADLDVAGTAVLGSLQVDADGSVGIGGDVGAIAGETLRVHGTLQADSLSDRGTIDGYHSTSLTFTDCAPLDRYYARRFEVVDGAMVTTYGRTAVQCRVPVPTGATVTAWSCHGDDVEVDWISRPWDEPYGEWEDWSWETGVSRTVDVTIEADDLHLLEVWIYERFERCTFEYTI